MIKSVVRVLLMCSLASLTVLNVQALHPARDGKAAQDNESAQEGIRAAINHYFKGHATGDASHMRKAFLPTAHIEGIREGKFTSWTVDEYCSFFKGKPADDESTRVRTIDYIDASGNSAMVRATLAHGSTVFTDYFVLLKVDGEWKIANKVYHGQRKDSVKR
ncbi:MAG TPA: nuclear transport factor 2 family protein [Blastocatellia bacterium]|nr:nuclear transport factor 2 family protein [Blastocatellia bacterium]